MNNRTWLRRLTYLSAFAAAFLAHACTDDNGDDFVGPPSDGDPDPGEVIASLDGPTGRIWGVKLAVQGPGVGADAVGSDFRDTTFDGHAMYTATRGDSVVMIAVGEVGTGPIGQFWMEDRAVLDSVTVTVMEVVGSDYGQLAAFLYSVTISKAR